MIKSPFYYANMNNQLKGKENNDSMYENYRIQEQISARRSPAK